MEATKPEGQATTDPDFIAGSDVVTYVNLLPADDGPHRYVVRATMYFQAIPPYYLLQRFSLAPRWPSDTAAVRAHEPAQHQRRGQPDPRLEAAADVGERAGGGRGERRRRRERAVAGTSSGPGDV